jgi:hypothetical protein
LPDCEGATGTDFDSLYPTPSNWFSAELSYEGPGRVEFGTVSLEGPATVTFDEGGYATALMKLEEEPAGRFGMHGLLTSRTPETTREGISLDIDLKGPPAPSLL